MGLANPGVRIDRDLAQVVAPFPLPDGFHLLPWTELDLAAIEPHWLALGDATATPNPFFEPWFLRPALELFDRPRKVSLALLVEEGRLTGIVPHIGLARHHGRRLPNAAVWLHHNTFLGTPLVASGSEQTFWSHYLARCDAEPDSALFLHFPMQAADGPLASSLKALCRRQKRQLRVVRAEKRALLASHLGAAAYRESAMPNKKRKELRRQYNRLAELGPLEFVRTRGADGIEHWLAEFLALEERGWKGRNRSSLASSPQTEQLFCRALAGAARLGRLERLTLAVDGRPVAMLATLLAGRGAFSFKTTYDEDLARFSPGVQLQLANLDLLDDPGIDWCDSCAAQDHAMIDHIWRERREIVWLNVAVGRGPRRWAGEAWTALESWQRSRKR